MLCVYRDITPTSEMRVEIQRIIRNLLWEKNRQANTAIDLQGIYNEYWDSTRHEFTVLSQS